MQERSDPADMSREDLEAEVRALRAALERLEGRVTTTDILRADRDRSDLQPDTAAMLQRELSARLETPLSDWEDVETADAFTADARDYLGDIELAERISLRVQEKDAGGAAYDILVDGVMIPGAKLHDPGSLSDDELREHAARHLRKTGLTAVRADLISRDRLQSYLSELARLGSRYGIELKPDICHGSMRVKPMTPEQGGYYAERLDEGFRVLGSYGSGQAWDEATDDIVGDDHHPDARAERARRWREENAEALADERRQGPTRLHAWLNELRDDDG